MSGMGIMVRRLVLRFLVVMDMMSMMGMVMRCVHTLSSFSLAVVAVLW